MKQHEKVFHQAAGSHLVKSNLAKPNKKAPLGQGGRFSAVVASGKTPALAAYIGRKKYGKEKFAQLSVKGRKEKNNA